MVEPLPFGLDEVRRALAEDRATEDVTTRLLGALGERRVAARFVAEGGFVVAGIPILATVFQELDTGAAMTPCLPEGAWTEAGATLRVIRPTKFALESITLQEDYQECWQGLKRHFQR